MFKTIAIVLIAGLAAMRAQENPKPAAPAMSVEEYSPRSTLVVPAHPVLRAKYPVIDVH
ncbi:MAG: hypothetical protein JO022_00645, partial [Acidobacteriaceae bacterium]|nr:hypothetical protein [Acidobacteriaceae bacterium]